MVTLRSKVSIHSPDATWMRKPALMPTRGSIRLVSPATRNPTVMPTPRLPITSPTSVSGKAGMLLQQRRQQHHRRKVEHAVDRHQHQADGVVAIPQQAQVEERRVAGEAVREEDVEGERGDDALDDDLRRLEPIEPHAARQHQLHRGHGGRQRQEPGPVELRPLRLSHPAAGPGAEPTNAASPSGTSMWNDQRQL